MKKRLVFGLLVVLLICFSVISIADRDRLSSHPSGTGGKTNLEKMRGDRASDSERESSQSPTGGVSEHFGRIKDFTKKYIIEEKDQNERPHENERAETNKPESIPTKEQPIKEEELEKHFEKQRHYFDEVKPKPLGFDFSQRVFEQQHIATLVKSEYYIGENVAIVLNPFFNNFECKVDFGDSNEKVGICETEYLHDYSLPGVYTIKIEARRGEIKRELVFNVNIMEKPGKPAREEEEAPVKIPEEIKQTIEKPTKEIPLPEKIPETEKKEEIVKKEPERKEKEQKIPEIKKEAEIVKQPEEISKPAIEQREEKEKAIVPPTPKVEEPIARETPQPIPAPTPSIPTTPPIPISKEEREGKKAEIPFGKEVVEIKKEEKEERVEVHKEIVKIDIEPKKEEIKKMIKERFFEEFPISAVPIEKEFEKPKEHMEEKIEAGIKKEIKPEEVAIEIRKKIAEIKPEILPKEELELLKKEEPDFIISSEHKKEDVEQLLEKIHVKRFEEEKAKLALETIKPEQRQLSSEQLNSELEHLAEVLIAEFPMIEDQVKDSFIRAEEVRKNVEIEKKVYYAREIKEETPKEITVVSLKVVPKKELKNFNIYEEIPKDVASDISEVVFYDTNHRVIEADPLVVWAFAEVSSPVEVSYGIKKRVSAEKLSSAKTLPIADKIVEKEFIAERKSPESLFRVFLPLLIVPLFGGLIAYYHKFGGIGAEKEEEIAIHDVMIKKKSEQLMGYIEEEIRHGADKAQIRRELLAKHWPDKMIYDVFRDLARKDATMLEHYTGKVGYEIKRMSMRGLSREQITDFLLNKKHYPRNLIERGFRFGG